MALCGARGILFIMGDARVFYGAFERSLREEGV